jgi:hypothetical protein
VEFETVPAGERLIDFETGPVKRSAENDDLVTGRAQRRRFLQSARIHREREAGDDCNPLR